MKEESMGLGWKFILFNQNKEEEWSGTSMASVLNPVRRNKFLKTILYEDHRPSASTHRLKRFFGPKNCTRETKHTTRKSRIWGSLNFRDPNGS